MPRGSKKGRLTGAARKQINDRRVNDAMSGRASDVAFARVTRILGANHVRVAIPSKHAPIEVNARIPNIFIRKGATPITTRDVVTIYVGRDFDADTSDYSTAHFDITSIFTQKQAHAMWKEGTIPQWMIHEDGSAVAATIENEGGFEFDYSGVDDEDDDGKPVDAGRANVTASGSKFDDGELDIDDI
jgi:hypothetical protein